MSGIYIHIPFCKKICYYCDFHFSLNLKNKKDIVDAICKEIKLQKDFYSPQTIIETIYFGGGTPSVLDSSEISQILNTISSNFPVSEQAEISLECNPDDLNLDYCKQIKLLGINRLSIGIQSFYDESLEVMNRRHNSSEAILSVKNAKQAGFQNITIDLMYGLPNMTMEMWKNSLQKAVELNVEHISAYALTIEERTVYFNFVKKGKIEISKDETVVEQFQEMIRYFQEFGYEQYEISNFAKDKMYSKHNTSYWQGKSYLGVGPSAHSFDGENRFWNISHNRKYLEELAKNIIPQQKETLSEKDKFNELILTGLRTKWGVNIDLIKESYPEKYYKIFSKNIANFITKGLVKQVDNNAILTDKGVMISDYIMSEFFVV